MSGMPSGPRPVGRRAGDGERGLGSVDATPVARPLPSRAPLRSLATRTPWLAGFGPPFEFGDFFAPEDTVLCALATAEALRAGEQDAGAPVARLVELTAGSALVTFAQLARHLELQAWGADIDASAVERAQRNAVARGLEDRVRFRELGLFDRRIVPWLRALRPGVVTCNPPYVPEPPDAALSLVAGAGADGAAHPRRAIAIAADAGVPRLVLSWCSLGDPIGVARTAARHGYALDALWTAAIADGEYSGAVHAYARTLPTAFLNEAPDTLAALAPDGSARFAYLLLAGSFVRTVATNDAASDATRAGVRAVARLVRAFARGGLPAVGALARRRGAAPPLHAYAADRWDEILLRAAAHGPGR